MDSVVVGLHVDSEGRITGKAPAAVPSGDYQASLTLESGAPFAGLTWPVHDPGSWPEDISLRREDLYRDDER